MSSSSSTFVLGPPPTLENDRVRVEPFDCNHHITPWLAGTASHPAIFRHTMFPEVSTAEAFRRELWDPHFASSQTECLFAILAKQNPASAPPADTGDADFAGILSLADTSPAHCSTDLGIMLLPGFHGTGVAANAVGLMLCWLLDPLPATSSSPSTQSPIAQPPSLGLRRVTWHASVLNAASRGFAERLGFEFEGVARWNRVLPIRSGEAAEGTLSLGSPPAEEVAGRGAPGRHTVVYSIVWEEWAEKREGVMGEMRRGGRRE